MPADFAASLRPWAIDDIDIGNLRLRIPAHAAERWLDTLATDHVDLWAIVPGLCDDGRVEEELEELMLMGSVDRDELEKTAWNVVAVAAGRDWWTALYLLGSARTETNINYVRGQLALHRIDATRISFAAFLDALYAIFSHHMNAEERTRFDTELMRPPPGVTVEPDRARNRKALTELLG